MLTIRKQQMDALAAYMARRFEDRMVAHLAAEFPAPAKERGEPALRALVQAGVRKGADHGIETERDVARLIKLMFEFGVEFERSPARLGAEETLRHPTLSGQAKTELLFLRLKGQPMES